MQRENNDTESETDGVEAELNEDTEEEEEESHLSTGEESVRKVDISDHHEEELEEIDDEELIIRIQQELEAIPNGDVQTERPVEETEEVEEEEEEDVEEEEEEEEEIPADENIIQQAVRLSKGQPTGNTKDFIALCIATGGLAMIIYIFLAFLGLSIPSKTLVVPKGATKPFFLGIHQRYIEDNYDGVIRVSGNQNMSVILLYSPYSLEAKWFRDEYFKTARDMKRLHGSLSPYFGATNCFDSNSPCRRKYNLKHYPAIMAQNFAGLVSAYNGPHRSAYLTRWLNRLQTPVLRVHSEDDIRYYVANHDLLVILYYRITTPPNPYQSASNFTRVAFSVLDGDPNSERVVFLMVTDEKFASVLQLHNEHDVVLVGSELNLMKTHHKGWTIDDLYKDVVAHMNAAKMHRIDFLNLGNNFHSTQLAEKFSKSSVLLFFSQDLNYGNNNYKMLWNLIKEYRTCPPNQDMISLEVEDTPKFAEDCTISLENNFCHKEFNNTLRFMMIDSDVESALAAKYGAEVDDMVVAVNSKQEITKFILRNVTSENIRCLIRQHHNVADNEFVTEVTEIITKKTATPEDIHEDAVGDPSLVRFTTNPSELLLERKINVVMFIGGSWHSASTSAIAPFHLAADRFKESRNLIDFSMVDTSEVTLPFNLNFDLLPKIIVTSADRVGSSWSFPEDFQITHTNLGLFILSRPGKIFGRLRWMDSCRGACRKRVQWEMRNERLQMKRQLSRNVVNSVRQRESIGYYDRMLRMIS